MIMAIQILKAILCFNYHQTMGQASYEVGPNVSNEGNCVNLQQELEDQTANILLAGGEVCSCIAS